MKNKPRTIFVWGDVLLTTEPVGNLADETFFASGYYSSLGFHYFKGYTDGYATASPVGTFPTNGYGLTDMSGNVLEWCYDWFSEDYYKTSSETNPQGPHIGQKKILRGGAFDITPTITRIARRLSNDPNIRHEEKGFRCVQTIP